MDENDNFIAGEGTNFEINKIRKVGSTIVITAALDWSENPDILPNRTIFILTFHHASIRSSMSGRSVDDIEELKVIGTRPLDPKGKLDPEYNFAILLY